MESIDLVLKFIIEITIHKATPATLVNHFWWSCEVGIKDGALKFITITVLTALEYPAL